MTLKEQIDGLTKAHADAAAKLSDAMASHVAAQSESELQITALKSDLDASKALIVAHEAAISEHVASLAAVREASALQAAELKAVSDALAAAKQTLEQPAYGDAKAGHVGPSIPDSGAGAPVAKVMTADQFTAAYNAAKSSEERNKLYAEFIRTNKENK